MKKLLVLMILPVFLTPLTIISTEKEWELTNEEQMAFLARPAHFTGLPKNPRLFGETLAYGDQDLTQVSTLLPADRSLVITDLVINDQLLPVFRLETGDFIEASQLFLFDDVELSRQDINQTLWLKEGATAYDKPYVIGAKTVETGLKPYQKVTATAVAETYSGIYYRIEDKGWVAAQDLHDDAVAAVQALLLSKYQKDHLGIYVKRLDDAAVAEVNADKVMYGASVAKLATIYEVQEALNQGRVQLTDQFKYVDAVNHFPGAYDPAGTGDMSKTPDDKDYSVDELLKALTKTSDNVASNMLGFYVTNQYNKTFHTDIWLLAGQRWDMVERDLSAKMAGQLMEALYLQGGEVLSALSETAFDDTRIAKEIPVPVAHKTGDADEFRHDVAIVYAERPFVLSILTENATYEDITAIANDVYDLLK